MDLCLRLFRRFFLDPPFRTRSGLKVTRLSSPTLVIAAEDAATARGFSILAEDADAADEFDTLRGFTTDVGSALLFTDVGADAVEEFDPARELTTVKEDAEEFDGGPGSSSLSST